MTFTRFYVIIVLICYYLSIFFFFLETKYILCYVIDNHKTYQNTSTTAYVHHTKIFGILDF